MLIITVAAIAAPKGKGPGSCKDTHENWYKYWTTGKNAVTVQKGGTYEIDTYDKSDERGDQTFISNARLISAAPQPQAAPAAASSGKWQPKSLEERREIFIESLAGRAMGSGQFSANDIPLLVQKANEAFDWLQAYKSQAQQQADLAYHAQQNNLAPLKPPQNLPNPTPPRVYNDSHMPEPPASWEREHPGAH